MLFRSYPDADIPVVQLSLNRLQSAEWHFNLAKKLSALREQGVLIIGSGNIIHNLSVMSRAHINQIGAGYDWAFDFREAVNQAIVERDDDTLIHYERCAPCRPGPGSRRGQGCTMTTDRTAGHRACPRTGNTAARSLRFSGDPGRPAFPRR